MDGHPRKVHIIGTIANGTVSNEARAGGPTRNWMRTQEKASHYTNHDQDKERSLTASFAKPNLPEIIDAVSKDRYSSRRLAPSISEVPLAPGPGAQTHTVPTAASTETSQSQLAPRFNPLVTSISLLGGRRPDSRVLYEAVKNVMMAKLKRHEMESLGWSSFEQILAAASQAKVVLVLNVGGKNFLKLLPPPPPLVHGPLNAADYEPEHRALVSTMIKLTDGKPGVGKSTVELANALKQCCPRLEGDYFLIARAEECGVLRIDRSTPGSTCAYLNPPLVRTSTIAQPSPIGTQSLPVPGPSQLPPKHLQSHVEKTLQMAKPVQSPSSPIQLARPTSPPKSLASPTSNAANLLPLPVRQRLINVLTRVTQGAPRAFADVDEVMRLLRLEYPWAKEEFLLSMITRAEEENIVVRERGQGSEGRESPGGPQASPSDTLMQNFNPNPSIKSPMAHPEPSRHGVPKPMAPKQSAPFGVAKNVKSTPSKSSKPKPTSSKPSEIKPKPVPPKPIQGAVRKPPGSQSILAKDVKPATGSQSTPKATPFEPSKPIYRRNDADHAKMPKSGGGWWH